MFGKAYLIYNVLLHHVRLALKDEKIHNLYQKSIKYNKLLFVFFLSFRTWFYSGVGNKLCYCRKLNGRKKPALDLSANKS